MTIYDIIGLLAPAFFMTAYAMTAMGKWDATMIKLHLCNLIGAIAILISLIHAWNLPMFVMEICWGGIAIWGLIKILKIKYL